MEAYDFDRITDRRNTFSYKWDIKEGELPMWVADMDFETAPCVKEALIRRAGAADRLHSGAADPPYPMAAMPAFRGNHHSL